MVQVQQLFEDSGDAVFGIDGKRRIAYVNAAFLEMLGKPAETIGGRPCCEVLCADDLASRRFCNSKCPIAREALQNQPMQNFDLVLTRSDGTRCWVNAGVYSAREQHVGPGEARVYFALRSVSGHRLIRQLASELRETQVAQRPPMLSPRETEILSLAAHGCDTADIGRELSIAPQTVRNHFKNIFSKLEVRNRSQAVAIALRQQMI